MTTNNFILSSITILAMSIINHANAQEVRHTSSVAEDPSSPFHYIETRCEITRYSDYDDIACVMERLHMSQTSGEGTIISQTRRRDDTYAQIRKIQEEEAARLEEYANTRPPAGKYRVLTQGNSYIVINSEGERVETTYDDLPFHIPYSEPDEMCSGTFCHDEEDNITALNRHVFRHTEHYQNQIVHEAEKIDDYYNVVCAMTTGICTVYLVGGERVRVNKQDLFQYLPTASGDYDCEDELCFEKGHLLVADRVVGLNPDYFSERENTGNPKDNPFYIPDDAPIP